MNLTETTKLFAYITRFEPRREVGDSTILAWGELLSDTGIDDAMTAVRDYYSTETWPIMPAHILNRVTRIRADRARADKRALTIAMNVIAADSQAVYSQLKRDADRSTLVAIGRQLQAGPVGDDLRDTIGRIRGQAAQAAEDNRQAALTVIAAMKSTARPPDTLSTPAERQDAA